MLRERRRNGSVVIYRVFLAAMIAAVVLFLMRVASGKLETDFSVGQVIHLSQNYEMGNIYDRKWRVDCKWQQKKQPGI